MALNTRSTFALRLLKHLHETTKTSIKVSSLKSTRTLHCSPIVQQDGDSCNEEIKKAVVDDEIHKAITGTKIRFNDDRKSWVSFNPMKESVSADWMSFLSQNINWDTFIEDKIESRRMEKLLALQTFSAERKQMLGGELAAARFIVAMNGKVKLYEDDHIYSMKTLKVKSLPTEKTAGLRVELVDLSGTELLYEGLENLFQTQSVVHLDISRCERLDEWAISRLAMMSSLVSLDLSHNSFITERSLIPLQHIPNLQRLDLRGIKYFKDQPLPLIFLEQHLPNCIITTDADQPTESS